MLLGLEREIKRKEKKRKERNNKDTPWCKP
jgi:hypothetical protein